MCLEFVDSFGLCNQFGEFTAMWWNKMTGSGSGQIREPPRFFGLYFSQLCVPDGATTIVPTLAAREGKQTKSNSPAGGASRRRHYNMRPDAHCKILTDSSLRTRQRRLLRRGMVRRP